MNFATSLLYLSCPNFSLAISFMCSYLAVRSSRIATRARMQNVHTGDNAVDLIAGSAASPSNCVEGSPPPSLQLGNGLPVALRAEDRKMLPCIWTFSMGLPHQHPRIHQLSLALPLWLLFQMFLSLKEAAAGGTCGLPHSGKKKRIPIRIACLCLLHRRLFSTLRENLETVWHCLWSHDVQQLLSLYQEALCSRLGAPSRRKTKI